MWIAVNNSWIFGFGLECLFLKGTVHPKIKICPQAMQGVHDVVLDQNRFGEIKFSPKFLSEIFACWKINTTSRCVNHVYTLPLKLSSVIKKNRTRFDFLCFHIRSKHFYRKGWQIWKIQKMHMIISDSECARTFTVHHLLTIGASAVNGCHQNESYNIW